MTATDTAKGIYIEFNANQLKLIAILAMVVDHTAIVLVPDSFPATSENNADIVKRLGNK